jgi:hypothetical protein
MSEYGLATEVLGRTSHAPQTLRIKELLPTLLDGPGAGRSNTRPSASSGQVAQLVEQRIENPRVGGSIPPLATIRNRSVPTTWVT